MSDLIRWGYFPYWLPPSFTAESFSTSWNLPGLFGDNPKSTQLCSFSVPNGRKARREVSIVQVLREYELEINDAKTSRFALPEPMEPLWVGKPLWRTQAVWR